LASAARLLGRSRGEERRTDRDGRQYPEALAIRDEPGNGPAELIGASAATEEIRRQIAQVASSTATVLPSTGKCSIKYYESLRSFLTMI